MNVPKGHITLYSGIHFNPKNFTEYDFQATDIAHSLALTCRFRGHSKRFYSVAEHSCHVHDFVYGLTEDYRQAAAALFHDAAEAYVGDTPGPLKTDLIREEERKILRCIFSKFCRPYTSIPDIVNQIDKNILHDEMHLLFDVDAEPIVGAHIQCWEWQKAEKEFLRRYQALKTWYGSEWWHETYGLANNWLTKYRKDKTNYDKDFKRDQEHLLTHNAR